MNNTEQIAIKIGRKFYQQVNLAKNIFLPGQNEEYYSKPILNGQAGNDHISQLLDSNSPIMVARFGATELSCVTNYIQMKRIENSTGIKKYINAIKGDEIYWNESIRKQMLNWSGFFPPTDEMLERFCIDFLAHTKNIDVLGVWFLPYENFIFHHYCPKATLLPLIGLEPFFYQNPWSRKLKNKKVLIIHPFQESIISQYNKRKLLFKDQHILPNFEIKVIKAVQSIANNKTKFNNWFEAYDSMCEKISNEDFDISIIGAGAYGLPLASFVKKIGKKAIHMGGATQIMFGIKGKRWDSRENYLKLYNQHWIKPLLSETPPEYQVVEDGCYW